MGDTVRISVTIPKRYLIIMNKLIEDGMYIEQGNIVREGLRIVFRNWRMPPFDTWTEEAKK